MGSVGSALHSLNEPSYTPSQCTPMRSSASRATVAETPLPHVTVADTERAGAGRELLGRRHLHGYRVVHGDEVVLPVDEDGAGNVTLPVLRVLGVRQGRARMPPAHVEHAQSRVAQVPLEPLAADERPLGNRVEPSCRHR